MLKYIMEQLECCDKNIFEIEYDELCKANAKILGKNKNTE